MDAMDEHAGSVRAREETDDASDRGEGAAEDFGFTRTNGRTGRPEEDEPGPRRKARSRKSGPAEQAWAPPAPSPSGASRHRQVRRRTHQNRGRFGRRAGLQLAAAARDFLSDSVGPWGVSCIRMVADLIVSLAHRCGVVVETVAVALHALASALVCRLADAPGTRRDLGRAVARARRSGAALAAHAAAGLGVAVRACARVVGVAVGRVSGERGRRWWSGLRNCRAAAALSALFGRIWAWRWKPWRSAGGAAEAEFPGEAAERGRPGGELERLLALAQVPEGELDPFGVLGVNTFATEAELKRAYRQLAVQVHPDKNKHPRAGEAFKVLRAAWDIVSNPETRREYELKRMAASELSRSMNEFLSKLQDDLKEAMNTMMCTKCEGKHKRFEMDREPHDARFCGDCNKRHGAEEGDLWAESSMLGLKITYFAFMDGKVYDITEWAGCQRIGISPDTHRVPYHISFGSKNSGGPARHRSPSSPPPPPAPPPPPPPSGSPSDLHDFFSRIFQGAPGSDASPNGAFFPPGASQHHHGNAASGTPPAPPPPPPPQPGFFPPRGEPGEGWSDAGRSARRRKRARKPFQR